MVIKLKRKTFEVEPKDQNPLDQGSQARKLRKYLETRYEIRTVKNPFKEGYFPELPRDITKLHDLDLSRLYGEFSAWAEYIHDTVAGYEVGFVFAEDDSKIEDAIERLRLVGAEDKKGVSKHVKDDMAFISEESLKKRRVKLEKKSMYKILQAKLDSIERHIKVLSREQSRREKNKEYERRDHKA